VDVGDRVNIRYLAYAAGTPTSATVALTVTKPDGTTVTPTPVFTAPNQYDSSFLTDQAGVWYWTWVASGTVDDQETGEITAMSPAPPVYSTLAMLKQSLGLASTDTTKDDLLNLALISASRAVENFCDERVFNLAKTATARTYPLGVYKITRTPRGERVRVDDIGSASGIIVELTPDNITWTAITDYDLYPDNALTKGQPVEAIQLRWTANERLWYNTDIRVTARWGWPQVPAAVENSTLLMATRLYKRKDSPEGIAGSTEWGLVRVPNLDPDIQRLLAAIHPPMMVG
jgi:hypothetical protein